MEIKRYINSTHNEHCRQVYVEDKDLRSVLRDFFDDAEVVAFEESDSMPSPDGLLPTDQKIRMALLAVIDDGEIAHDYDYHIIMQLLTEKYGMTFSNGQSFVNYLKSLGITHHLPSADSVNQKIRLMRGQFPEWSWTGTDHLEEIRRNNIARRFVHEMNRL